MHTSLQDVGILFAVIAALLGWVYQLGYASSRLTRNEKDILELKGSNEQFRRDHEQNDQKAQDKIAEGFQRVYDKLDDLPCHNPGYKKDKCA